MEGLQQTIPNSFARVLFLHQTSKSQEWEQWVRLQNRGEALNLRPKRPEI